MKLLSLIFGLMLVNFSFAGEVETDCPAMNQNREKITVAKTGTKAKTRSATAQ
jgi:hypothetical protein